MSCIADSSTWTINYDERGNRSSISDPDAGTSYYTYDALGREISKTDGRGVVFVTNYDYLGRVTSISATKNNDTETITYSYGTSGTGQLRLVGRTLGSWSDSYEYDQYGRMITENEGGHTATFTYNAAGLISRMTWLSGGYTDHYVDFTYDTLGNCTSQSAINGAIQWNLTGYTGSTTTSTMRLHNNANLFTRTTSLDTYGNLSSQILTRGNTTLQSNGYTFNSATGNLTSRTLGGVTQNFTYDGVDRLKVVSSGNQTVMSMTYQSNGNIASKTGIGSYDYNTNYKPHAVQAVDNTLGLIPEGTQSVTYNLWGKVSEVSAVVGNDTYRYELTYGPDLQRVLAVLWKNNNLVHLITYGHDYEEKYQDGEITRYWYVNGTDGNRAVYTTHTQMGDKAYCMDMDHLGSVTAMYDQYGTKCYGASFDPWGKRTLMSGSIEFDRGFTGHEHIDEINLIDMNGRMYDPLIGRFLSPDNYIQSLGNPQNYNRYSYCLNNPLRYTDPSGEKISWLWGLAVALNIIPIESVIAYTTVTSTDAVTSATIGFIVGGIDESANRATNSIKIATGLLESDCKDGNELEQFGRSYFRSIWCSPTSLFGYAYATNANYFDRVDVEKLYGATVIRTKLVDGGVTFGHYINISSDYDIDDFMSTLIHEYGHFMQARDWGGFSALSGGVFSLVSAMDFFPRNGMGHKDMWIERDASARGARYLRGEYDSISTKYDQENPQGYYDLRMLHNMFIPFSVGFGIYNIFNPN